MADILRRIPYSEKDIPAQVAEPYLKVSDGFLQLEGLCFDREENLVFCDVYQGGIYRVKKGAETVETLLTLPGENPSSVKLGPDGALYISCLGDFRSTGSLKRFDPESGEVSDVVPASAGYVIDDICFRRDGRLYFSDFKGGATDRIGGIYLVDTEVDTGDGEPLINRLCGFLGVPNGLSLSTDERGIWVTEMAANQLHFIELEEDGITVPPFGDLLPYRFSGLNGPDSCSVDSEGNLYVAMYQQGRVLVFSPAGIPVKQIILPDSWDGHNLRSTHPRIIPGTKTLLICTNDYDGGNGSWIFRADALATPL